MKEVASDNESLLVDLSYLMIWTVVAQELVWFCDADGGASELASYYIY
jgi:hypothetical protein